MNVVGGDALVVRSRVPWAWVQQYGGREAVIARGPFTEEGDLALLTDHRITHVVAKNSGGTGIMPRVE